MPGFDRFSRTTARFYNNPRDTPIELRVDNPKWAFFLDESEWEEGHRYSSQELLSYARSYAGDTDRSDDLPVLNGTVSNELFYVPSYSRQGLFQKYGRVESEISRNDLLGKSLSGLLQSRMGTTGIDPSFSGGTVDLGGIPHYLVGFLGQGEVRIDGVTMSGVDEDTPLSDLYVQAMSAKDPETYAWTLGERSVPLLAEWSESDPVVKAADPEYVDGLDAFVSSQGDRDVYRLTYDASLTNSYAGWAGKTTSADGTWTAQTVQASKTDAVFDFRFIDFTFRDDSETYVLPATSDPFDIIDDVDTNPIENPSLMPRWLLILIGCIAAVLVLVVLAVLFPVFRLADVYLMLAEAVVRGGQGATAAEALGCVNQVRERAYGDTSGNIVEAQMTTDFLLDERARELYTECVRRTDLIRYNRFTTADYLWQWKGGARDGQAVDGKFNYYPIPSTELTANPNLYNEGY